RAAQDLGRRRWWAVHMGGAPDVAVVKAHHVQAASRELAAEALLPRDHLRAEAHDQQGRRVRLLAEGLIAERHAPTHVPELPRHDPRTVAFRSLASHCGGDLY